MKKLSLTEHLPRMCLIRDNSFCPKIFNFVYKCVVPIISHSPSLDDADAKHRKQNVHIFMIL